MRIIFLPIFLVIFLLNFQNSAIALTFNQYYELSECVDTYRTFRQYKKNLQKFKEGKNNYIGRLDRGELLIIVKKII